MGNTTLTEAKTLEVGETMRYHSHVIERQPDEKDDVLGMKLPERYIISGPFLGYRDKDFFTLGDARAQIDCAIQHTRLVLADIDGTAPGQAALEACRQIVWKLNHTHADDSGKTWRATVNRFELLTWTRRPDDDSSAKDL